jgi:hypothetical protein
VPLHHFYRYHVYGHCVQQCLKMFCGFVAMHRRKWAGAQGLS